MIPQRQRVNGSLARGFIFLHGGMVLEVRIPNVHFSYNHVKHLLSDADEWPPPGIVGVDKHVLGYFRSLAGFYVTKCAT